LSDYPKVLRALRKVVKKGYPKFFKEDFRSYQLAIKKLLLKFNKMRMNMKTK